jgi:hypothetical protein
MPTNGNVVSVPGGIDETSSDDSSDYELPPGIANHAEGGIVALPGLIKDKINRVKHAEMAELAAANAVGKDAKEILA